MLCWPTIRLQDNGGPSTRASNECDVLAAGFVVDGQKQPDDAMKHVGVHPSNLCLVPWAKGASR